MHPNTTLEPRLECYGADYALLRPEPEDVRYVLTEQGHRALAMARAFDKGAHGRRWLRVPEQKRG